MSIVIHQADLDSDQGVIVDMLRRYLSSAADDRHYKWLYKENPHGTARAWIARDTANQAVVGVAAAFPRCVFLKGESRLVWVFGDFCVSERYRSLGPAMQIQRALLAAAAAMPDLAGWYDFPSHNMAAVYKRLGLTEQGALIRMARLLRADRVVAQSYGHPGLARGAALLGNLWLALSIGVKSIDRTISVQSHVGSFTAEFTDLAEVAGSQYGACTNRSADYLNWRFLENPHNRYECLVARKSGRLCGYLLFTWNAEDAILIDLFGIKQESILDSLLSTLAKELRRRGVMTISAPVVEGHPWRGLLMRAGYRDREHSPFVTCPGTGTLAQGFEGPRGAWHFMHGDRDS